MGQDLLALSSNWKPSPCLQSTPLPLISLEEALERSSLKSGISRRDFLAELLKDVQHQRLLPLLAMLPRGWRQEPASLPEHLRGLGILLGDGLVSPLLLAAFADDLQHLLPSPTKAKTSALNLWSQRSCCDSSGNHSPLADGLETWRSQAKASLQLRNKNLKPKAHGGLGGLASLGGEITWRNQGLTYLQSAEARHRNQQLAQVFNALGSNLLRGQGLVMGVDTYRFEGQSCGKDLIHCLQAKGWTCQARVRTSVASFGLGASTPGADRHQWTQIPLAVPYRTGLQETNQKELHALLPHACLELELQPPEDETVLLQYYQGTEGLNGWAAMNDLDRPWQNGRSNGTVRYAPTVFRDRQLADAVELCELMGAIHNSEASMGNLHLGGYGAIGFCIDSTALLEQALTGQTSLFPLTLGGLWRERLCTQLERLLQLNMRPKDEAVDRYKQAIKELPQDLYHNSNTRQDAKRRLLESQPKCSPFLLIQHLNQEQS